MIELNAVQSLLSSYAFSTIHFAIAIIVFLETRRSVGMLIPASCCLFFIGFFSPFQFQSWTGLVLTASISAIVGDNLNFLLSRRHPALPPIYKHGLLAQRDLKKTTSFYEKWGIFSPLIGRLIPGKKESIPLVIARQQFSYLLFLLLNSIGCFLWATCWLGSGYYLALWLNLANFWLSQSSLLIPFILTTLLILYSSKWMLQRYGLTLSLKIIYLLKRLGKQISCSPYYKLWRYRNPQINTFLKNRFDSSKFTGLSTTLFVLVGVYLFLLFSGLAEDFVSGDRITRFDTHIANLFLLLRADWLTAFMIWITLFGTARIVSLILIASSLWLWVYRKTIYIIPLWISGIAIIFITFLGKFIFHRQRPPFPIYQEISYSFPSAHASISIGLYGFLAYILIRNTRDWALKINYGYSALVFILLIGFSRVYLGVHYVSDILSGYVLGALFLTIAIALTEWLKDRLPIKPITQSPSLKNVFITSICVVSFSLFILNGQLYKPTPNPSQAPLLRQYTSVDELFSDPTQLNTETIVGTPQAPINIVFQATSQQQIDTALTNTGWIKTTPMTLGSFMELPPPAFPMFWQSHIQQASYIKPQTMNSPKQQLWLWLAGEIRHDKNLPTETIYVGMTLQIKTQIFNFIPEIYPDLNQARNHLLTEMQTIIPKIDTSHLTVGKQTIGNTLWNSPFYSDGQVAIIRLLNSDPNDE